MAERRIAGADAVEIDLHAEGAQCAEELRRRRRTVHQRRLGDLEPEVTRFEPRRVDRLLDQVQEILLHQLPAGYVDRDVVDSGGRELPLPLRERAARLLE